MVQILGLPVPQMVDAEVVSMFSQRSKVVQFRGVWEGIWPWSRQLNPLLGVWKAAFSHD